jgi:hypothetical protein
MAPANSNDENTEVSLPIPTRSVRVPIAQAEPRKQLLLCTELSVTNTHLLKANRERASLPPSHWHSSHKYDAILCLYVREYVKQAAAPQRPENTSRSG